MVYSIGGVVEAAPSTDADDHRHMRNRYKRHAHTPEKGQVQTKHTHARAQRTCGGKRCRPTLDRKKKNARERWEANLLVEKQHES